MASKTVKEEKEVIEQVVEVEKTSKVEKPTIKKLSIYEIKRHAMIRNIDEDTLLEMLLLNNGDMIKVDESLSEFKRHVKGTNLPKSAIVKYMKYVRM